MTVAYFLRHDLRVGIADIQYDLTGNLDGRVSCIGSSLLTGGSVGSDHHRAVRAGIASGGEVVVRQYVTYRFEGEGKVAHRTVNYPRRQAQPEPDNLLLETEPVVLEEKTEHGVIGAPAIRFRMSEVQLKSELAPLPIYLYAEAIHFDSVDRVDLSGVVIYGRAITFVNCGRVVIGQDAQTETRIFARTLLIEARELEIHGGHIRTKICVDVDTFEGQTTMQVGKRLVHSGGALECAHLSTGLGEGCQVEVTALNSPLEPLADALDGDA
jgi:hypothetical protein